MKRKRLLVIGVLIAFAITGFVLLRDSGGGKLPAGNRTPMISLGDSHGVVLAADGSIWSWGGEDRGWPVLGRGKKNLSTKLKRIGSETNWVSVSAGDDHNLALKSDGTMWAWGADYGGELGDGRTGMKLADGSLNVQNRPVRSVAGNDWAQVWASGNSSFALKRNGSLWAWGLNNFSQLGIGSWKDSPNAVQVGTGTNWVKVKSGGMNAAAIQSDGSLWIWGTSSALDISAKQSRGNFLAPTRFTADTNWVDVSIAFNLWMAVKSDGTLWAWGHHAQTFTGNRSDWRTPVQIGRDADWVSVCSSADGWHHLLEKRDNSFWILESANDSPVSVKLRKIELPPNVVASAAGGGAIAVVTQDGQVWTCGTLLGRHGLKDRFMRFAEGVCWRLGWKVRWRYNQSKIVQEKPHPVGVE